MANETPTGNAPAPGVITDMKTGEKKDSVTGKSKGNKKKQKAGFVTVEQLNTIVEEQANLKAVLSSMAGQKGITLEQLKEELARESAAQTAAFTASTAFFAERLAKAGEESGNKAFADAVRGTKPTTLWGRFKTHTHRTVNYGDVYWILLGGIVIAVVYNGVAYAFRNKVVFPFAKEFKTGVGADRRAAGMGGRDGRVRIMPSRASA